MNARRGRRGFGTRGNELQVKQVIVPGNWNQRGAASSEEIKKCAFFAHSSMDLTDSGVVLEVLNRTPVEDYVPSTRNKKYRKRKMSKCLLKNGALLCDSFSQTSEILQQRDQQVEVPHRQNFIEDKLLKRNIERKIQCYENKVKEEELSNCRRQRHLEHQSMDELENLVETWSALVKKRKERTEENILSPSSRHHSVRLRSQPVDISLISKKYWNDRTDGKPTKERFKPKENSREEIHQRGGLDQLEDEFIRKLVFVDDCDEDLD